MTPPRLHPEPESEQPTRDGLAHASPCETLRNHREGYCTQRALIWGCVVIAAGVAVYLWGRMDNFQSGATERAVAISAINSRLDSIDNSLSRIENGLAAHVARP
jgi:hypothetical protein